MNNFTTTFRTANPTWPSKFYALRIPINHILVSKEWEVLNLYSIELKGSDHPSLILEASLKNKGIRLMPKEKQPEPTY